MDTIVDGNYIHQEMHAMMFEAGLTSKVKGVVRPRKQYGILPPEQRISQRDKKKQRIAVSNAAKLTNQHLEGTFVGALLEQARLYPEVP